MYSTLPTKLSQTLIKDRFRFKQALDGLKRKKLPQNDQAWSNLAQKIEDSIAKVELNRQTVPNIVYNDALPVAQRKEELIELIKQHQVVVIAGETGSGKTTQIPKMCLDAGLGVFGRIGCTQPRRLAARSVAERLAEELDSTLGELVGYQVRFHDQVHQQSLIKVMTDGILLAEVQNDRFLNQYDTIIIDEAHERSINIDFLLGILKTLLPKRPDLKLVITSATIDTDRFAQFFENAPVVEVSGRTYPVELRYRPLTKFEDDAGNAFEQDIPTGILHALDELSEQDPFGDVLVFQVGERDIKETAEALRKAHLKNTKIIPLYARLSMAEQNKVFQTSQKRRIILATNVAETSLTVPGIKYVIDPGLARISRYSVRSKVQRLPVEKVSQASANQRKGRCGRVSNGICIRLYDEEDFNSRSPFTPPEIHRTALATIILQMANMKLGNVKNFPFIEPPEEKVINDGFRQLHELGALDEKRQLTNEGRQLAKLPLDPRMAKMVTEGEKNAVLTEVLVIATALSIQDPREMNETTRQAAQKAHETFVDERSDFLFFLNLWHFYEAQKRHLSQSKLRKLCKTNYLSYMRMKEWHDLFWQLETNLKRIGMKVGSLHLREEVQQGGQAQERLSEMHSMAVHQSLLAGLLGNIAMREDNKNYLGTRNTKLFIHPSSVQFKQKPKWMLSGELIETTKLYARNNAAIDIQWVERIAKHLIKHHYADPHWQRKSGQVGAFESITLYGLPIVTRRRCNYGAINPVDARKIFIQSALVNGEFNSKVAFFLHNQAVIAQIENIENKLRRPDYMVENAVLYDFYDTKIPQNVYSQPTLETWVKKADIATLKALNLTEDFLMKQGIDDELLAAFPDQVQLPNQLPLQVDYQFQPGKVQDGVVFHIPLSALNLVDAKTFEWLTPGFIKEKISCYIKSLPKSLRKQFVPVPQYAELVLQEMSADKMNEKGDFETQLIWALNRRASQKVNQNDFKELTLPAHLLPYFILEDDKGKSLAEGGDLNELKQATQHLIDQKIQQHQHRRKKEKHIESWNFGDLAESQTIRNQEVEMLAFPALQVQEKGIVLALFSNQKEASQAHAQAVWILIKNLLNDKEKYLKKKLTLQKACLCYAPYGTCQELTQQVIERALHQLVADPAKIRQQSQFETTLEQVRLDWVSQAQKVAKQVDVILTSHQKVAKKVRGKINPRWLGSLADIQSQLDSLIATNFVQNTPDKWFQQLPRYLDGIEKRLAKIDIDPSKDTLQIQRIQPLINRYQVLAKDPNYHNAAEVIHIGWMLEELRLSLFSQPMKTLVPVSVKRLEKLLSDLGG